MTSRPIIDSKTALVVVDVQNDFCPGGKLPVENGDEIVPVLNKYIQRFTTRRLSVFFTRDWHPENHVSFKERGGIWPLHCVQNTSGAEFHPALKVPPDAVVVSKAIESKKEAYSGFEGTVLEAELNRRGISKVLVGGLATDYCVKNTVSDALRKGFQVCFLADAIRGVDVNPGDSEKAIQEMMSKGAVKVDLQCLITVD